jgi:hypothetical protein
MRSDRLKQVLLELDPNFDEKTLGFSKFNRFVAEASNRGLLRLHKLENGQFEIALADSAVEEVAKPDRQARGRRRSREPREPRESTETADRTESTGARVTPESEAGSEPARPTPPERRPTEPHVADGRKPGGDPLRDAYGLLTRAAHELGATIERAVRDSDLKRRMLDFEPDWDESSIGFSKFSRFLRQAHDAEVINLRKIDSGAYEVALPGRAEAVDEKPAPEDGRSERRPRADRGRRGPRRDREEAVAMQSAMELEPAPVVGEEPTQPAAAALPATAPQPAPPPAAAPRAASPAPTTPVGLRRGSRSPRLGGAPPLLEGQVVATSKTAAAASGARRPDPQPRAPAITELGLPRDRDAIIEYVTKSYKGIGQKTAESLVDATGVDRFFATLNDAPDRVKEIIGAKRGETLLEAWHDDYAARLVAARGTSASPAAPGGNAGDGGKPNGGRRGGRRRGGRGRKRPATAKG